MSRNLKARKRLALATSLALAGATIFSSAASAIGVPPIPRDPACDQRMVNECVGTWQSLGYWSYDHCVGHRQCSECPPWFGYMCGVGPNYATAPDKGTRPW
ncbi:MAG: hypothetical protein ABWX67_08270 [Allosphingosinicella sp.]